MCVYVYIHTYLFQYVSVYFNIYFWLFISISYIFPTRFLCIYPAYINSKKTLAEGRRIPAEKVSVAASVIYNWGFFVCVCFLIWMCLSRLWRTHRVLRSGTFSPPLDSMFLWRSDHGFIRVLILVFSVDVKSWHHFPLTEQDVPARMEQRRSVQRKSADSAQTRGWKFVPREVWI